MRTLFLGLTLTLLSTVAWAKPIVIAVIDTGFTPRLGYPDANLCKFGHADLTSKDPKANSVPKDEVGHGTHIVYTIQNQLKDVPSDSFCMVVLKYYKPGISGETSIANTVKALRRAYNMRVKVINYSSSGTTPEPTERVLVEKILKSKITIVAAAGNDGAEIVKEKEYNKRKKKDLFNRPFYGIAYTRPFLPQYTEEYPGNYDSRIILVGNLEKNGISHSPSSNYGDRVNAWEIGTDVESAGIKMTGTSQATAVHTGKLVRKMIQERK